MDEKSVKNDSRKFGHREYLDKMPTATMEQLNIAKLLKISNEDDASLRSYVIQLQELTECTEDQAITALYDCENNLERAVELLLDKFRCGQDEEWHTTTGKRTKAKSSNDADLSVKTENKKHSDRIKSRKSGTVSRDHGDSNGCDSSDTQLPHPKDVRTRKAPAFSMDKNNEAKNRTNESGNAARPKRDTKNPNLAQVTSDKRNKPTTRNESEAWDPYTEYGNWGGESIEIINSDATIAKGLQVDACIPTELLTDVDGDINRFCNETERIETQTLSNDEHDSPDVIDSEGLFTRKALSKPLPTTAAEHFPNVPVFIMPGIAPDVPLKWNIKFGGEYSVSQSTANAIRATQNSVKETFSSVGVANSQLAQDSQISSYETALSPPKLSESKYELNKPPANYSTLQEPSGVCTKPNMNDATFPSNQFKNVSNIQKISAFPNPQSSHNVGFTSGGNNTQSTYLDQPFKNYLLSGLPNEINSLSANDAVPKMVKTSQFALQPSTQGHQTINTLQQNPNQPFQHQLGKTTLSQMPAHDSSQTILSNVQQSQQQQATTLPPGMPHFIGQYPTAAYHMFNLPGSSSGGPALMDIDQLQFMQQRMLYDAHLQQQAATTAHSILTSTSDAPSTSKPLGHNLPGSTGHMTATNTSMRPELLASTMGHAPQMMATGHPYPYYPGFLLMNGYPNPFMNQQQPHQHTNQEGGHPQCSVSPQSQPVNQPQVYSNMKASNATISSYDDLLEMKYGDQVKQVGFKNNSNQPIYGHFSGQAVSTEGMGPKLPQAAHSTNSGLPQNYNTNTGGLHPQQFSSQLYQSATASTPYLQAAVAVAAVAAASAKASAQQQVNNVGSVPNSNQSSVSGSGVNNNIVPGTQTGNLAGHGQMHMTGDPTQGMVLGSAGNSVHHPRSVMQHQH